MKIAVLGDIHGNHLALEAVLAEIGKEKVDALFAVGDFLGYYYHPAEVLEMCIGREIEMIKGNHETAFLDIHGGNSHLGARYKDIYGSGLDIAEKSLSGGQIEFLRRLPEKRSVDAEGRRILFCHGSPADANEYLYPDTDENKLERFVDNKYDVFLMGHTHYPMCRKIKDILFINPGSVGQPRNSSGGGAHWLVLETGSLKVEQKVTKYDHSALVKEAMEIDPDKAYLREIFNR